MTFALRTSGLTTSLLIPAGIFLVMTLFSQFAWVAGILIIVFMVVMSRLTSSVLSTFFSVKCSAFIHLWSLILNVFIVTSLLGAVLTFGRLTPIVIALAFLITGLTITIFSGWKKTGDTLEKTQEEMVENAPGLLSSFGIALFVMLFGVAWYMLSSSSTGDAIGNPWKVIHSWYAPLFAVITMLVGLLLYTRLTIKSKIIVLSMHALLLHAYLPLTHQLFYGADGWRHLGNIASIIHEEPIIEATLSQTPSIGARLGVAAYAQFWSFSALLVRFGGMDPIRIIQWLLPVLSALFVPALLYAIGRALSLSRQTSLVLVWLSALPYALQVAGSFTLPVNLGFIFWLASLLLVLERARNPVSGQVGFLLVIGLLSVFSYSLFCILFWISWILVEVLLKVKDASEQVRRFVLVTGSVFGIGLLPLIEVVMQYSHTASPVQWFACIKQFVGNFLAVYLATGPRPHDIPSGNILFNQIPSQLFVETLFTKHLWWLVLAAIAFWSLAFVGWIIVVREKTVARTWLAVVSVICFGSYGARYLLVGEQVFTRRLDVVLAFIAVVLVSIGAEYVAKRMPPTFRRLQVFGIIAVTSSVITASYTLGPDTGALSTDAYAAMQEVAKNDTAHCVVADTYPLLALEALTRRRVIGGGFPIDQYYGQPELDKVRYGFQTDPTDQWWHRALKVTHASHCWLLGPANSQISGKQVGQYGPLTLWYYPN